MEMTTFADCKPRVQTVHFNRIAMQRGSSYVWTVHNSRGCFNVRRVVLLKPFVSVFQRDGRQPRAKFKGVGTLKISNGEAFIR
jgi:hypothetical protein